MGIDRRDFLKGVREDIPLKPGMAITVDLPCIEMGLGCGAGYTEDPILITETGYELLHETEAPLLIA